MSSLVEIASLAATYASAQEIISVSYSYTAIPAANDPPVVFAIASSKTNVFDWTLATCEGTCAFDSARNAYTVTRADSAKTGAFTIAVPPHCWSKTDRLVVAAFLAGAPERSILTAGVTASFPFIAGVSALTPPTARFATEQTGSAASTGRLLLSLDAASAAALLPGARGSVGSLTLRLPPRWSVPTGTSCPFIYRTSADFYWVSADPSVLFTTSAPSAGPDGSLLITLTPPVSAPAVPAAALTGFHLICRGVTPAAGAPQPMWLSLAGVGASFLAEHARPAELSFDPAADAAERPRFVGWELTHSDPAAAKRFTLASFLSRITRNIPDVEAVFTPRTAKAARVTVGFAGGARVYASFFAEPARLEAYAAAMSALDAPASWAYVAGSLTEGQQGQWLCGDPAAGAAFAACAVANSCGDNFIAPLACVHAGAADASPHRCALLPRPQSHITTGCGAWLCKTAAGALVDCEAAAVCENGCAQAVTIVVDSSAAAGQHLDPEFQAGRFRQFCIVNGSEKSPAEFCPRALVPPARYAVTCDAVSTCRPSCMSAAGAAKACGSDLTWGPCGTQCGPGSQQRLTACSGADLVPEAPIPAASLVSWALCPAPSFALSRACFGSAGCADFGWRCRTSAGVMALCTDPATGASTVGFGSCSSSCGAGVSTRTVVCSVLSPQGVAVPTLGAADEALCTARSSKPAVTATCRSDACPQAGWRCYRHGSDPAVGVPCTGAGADAATFACPTAGCFAADPARKRGVACYDAVTGARVGDAACAALPKPVTVTACPPVYSDCIVSFASALCARTDAADAVAGTLTDMSSSNNALALAPGFAAPDSGLCLPLMSKPPPVFRVGTCVDREGAAVPGACTDSKVREPCLLPRCPVAGESVAYSWAFDDESGEAACVPGCISYRPVHVLCMARAGEAEPTSVDHFFCSGVPGKPAPFLACPSTPCGNGGVCTPVPVMIGAARHAGAYARCECAVGFAGEQCTDSIAVTDAAVDAGSGAVRWTFSGQQTGDAAALASAAAPFLILFVTPNSPHVGGSSALAAASETDSWTATVLTVIVATATCLKSGASSFTSALPSGALAALRPGTYTAHLTIGGTATDSAAKFTVAPACMSPGDGAAPPADLCLNGGTCDHNTGACACPGDFTGARCDTSPCASKGCNPLTSSCDISANGLWATCVCNAGFKGATCDKLASTCVRDVFEGTCTNGAQRALMLSLGQPSCGACQCLGGWTGKLCTVCARSCSNGGTPTDDCARCTCLPGFHGEACELRHIEATLVFARTEQTEWYFTPDPPSTAAVAEWVTSTTRSLDALIAAARLTNLATGAVTPRSLPAVTSHVLEHRPATDISGGDYIRVRLRLSESGVSAADKMYNVYAAASTLRSVFSSPLAKCARVDSADRAAAALSVRHSGDERMSLTSQRLLSALPSLAALHLAAGVGLRDPNCDAAAAGFECPRGAGNMGEIDEEDDPEPTGAGGTGGLSKGAKIGVGAGVGVGGAVLFAIVAALCIMRRKPPARTGEREVAMQTVTSRV